MPQRVIIVHGGAGARAADDVPEDARAGCLKAAQVGHRLLDSGASALDAVEAAVAALEDDPQFNAGTGACLNEAGEIEFDAALVEGTTRRAGAVGALAGEFAHPIHVARAVMEHAGHVLLVAHGAREFALARGFPTVPRESLLTARARRRWEAAREKRGHGRGHGTVGAVAVDEQGRVAAATSTGGMVHKRVGRVGDTPILGAGTFADDLGGAVSATGDGDCILRVSLAAFVGGLLREGKSAQAAAQAGVRELGRVSGEGGLIVVDRAGGVGVAWNTERMAFAWVRGDVNETGF